MGQKAGFVKGMTVTVAKGALACAHKRRQLMTRAGLTEEELTTRFTVVAVEGRDLNVKSPFQAAPVLIHHKFFEAANS